jgi:hypothetical protein
MASRDWLDKTTSPHLKFQNLPARDSAGQPNPRECRRFSHTRKEHGGDRTGWLGWEDSNSQMSLPKLAFEVWPEFPFILGRLAIRDFPG